MDMKEMRAEAKKRLIAKYGIGNVRVHGGRGTAWHWTDVLVIVPEPCVIDCRCELSEVRWQKCRACRDTRSAIEKEIRDIVRPVGDWPTFTSDDGYDTVMSCVSVNVTYIE